MENEQQELKNLKIVYTQETVIINGYIIPPVAVIVLVTNMFVILIYFKQFRQTTNNIRKISSILYISIATANTLAILPISVWYFYLFTLGNMANTYFVPYNLCWEWNFFTYVDVFPHMASIWFVTILSVQRYMIIKHPFVSSEKWTLKRMYILLIVVWLVAFTMQLPLVFETYFTPKYISVNTTTNVSSILGCSAHYADWLDGNGETSEIISYLLKLIGVIFIPSFLIIYSDVSLVLFLKESSNVRKILVKTSSTEKDQASGSVRSNYVTFQYDLTDSESRRQTLLVVILSSIVFVVEIPYAVLLIVHIHFISIQDYKLKNWLWVGPAGNFINLTMHVSYPILFILSCLLSRQFRKLLLNMLCPVTNKFLKKNRKTLDENNTYQGVESV